MTERIKVAARKEIAPGRMFYVSVDGLPVALANVAGTIYAFGDACRHQGGSLSSGVLRDDVATCPWHGWAYNVRTGKSVIPPVGVRVPTYRVEFDGDDVYVLINWEEE
jgi:nitrite reductase/ring-hydroxylating ferredoxin subunit